METIKRQTKLTTAFVLALCVLISAGIPAGYFILGYQHQAAVLKTEAYMNATFLSQIINENPDYWQYEQHRLVESLDTYTSENYKEMRRVIGTDNSVIAESGLQADAPFIAVFHTLYDSGNIVGSLEIKSSLRPLLVHTVVVTAFSVLIGLSVFFTLKFFPLRTLSIALRASYEEKERAVAILNNIPDIAWLKDREDRYIAANGPFCKLCGVAPEKLLGMTDPDIWPRDLAEHYQADDREVMETGKPKHIEEPIIDTEGRKTWILTIKTPIFNDRGQVIGTTGISRDFTERKHMEEALRESEERYRTVVDNVGIGIALISPEMEILSLNEQMRKWSPAIDVSKRPICFGSFNRPPREEICSYCPTVKTLKDGLVHEFITETPMERGIINYKVVSSPLKDSEGNVIAAIELVEDITERKRWEDEISRLNKELEIRVEESTKQLLEAQEELLRKEKLAILGQLAGSVGHELRNPLGVMNNAVYFLKTVLPESNETASEYLDIIKSEIDNSERIISDLLDFSRTKPPQFQTIPVKDLINKSLGKCTVPEGIQINWDIPETLPCVKVDPFQMEQVFQNLITNAIQAIMRGGTVTISAKKGKGVSEKQRIPSPQSSIIPDVGFIEISVTDTGEGISSENMKKLFQPLFTTKAKGIGLGLVVSKKLTEANGGKIEVESQAGKGTTFSVILPCEGE